MVNVTIIFTMIIIDVCQELGVENGVVWGKAEHQGEDREKPHWLGKGRPHMASHGEWRDRMGLSWTWGGW